jgi:myosin heavy subunit
MMIHVSCRNYHVFYYLLRGADDLEREKLRLGKPEDYFYLRQVRDMLNHTVMGEI